MNLLATLTVTLARWLKKISPGQREWSKEWCRAHPWEFIKFAWKAPRLRGGF